MKTIYFKFQENDGAVVMEKQKAAKVIHETENGVVYAEYDLNGKKKTTAFCEGQYSEVPYKMSF